MKLLVTGAGGFLGRHVVAAATKAGHEVRAVVRPKSPASAAWAEDPAIEVFRADLRTRAGLGGICDGIDCVVHLAAAKSGDFYDQFAGTVIATENLLGEMVEAEVGQIVLTSSFAVYEYLRRPARSEISEESPLAVDPEARDEYCRTKLLQEQLVRKAAEEWGWSHMILRPGVIYGRDNLWNGRVGFPINSRWWVCTAPFSTVPLTYVENCADAIVKAAERTADNVAQVVNVVDDDLPNHWIYLRRFASLQPVRPGVIPLPWIVLRVLAGTASFVNRLALRNSGKLPGLLVPARVHARCKPMRYPTKYVRHVIAFRMSCGWEVVGRKADGTSSTS
ncbi:NAD(P)-dependent oxidoreductase [Thioalkalivibrio sp. XN8]|uniref:NAD-dependent epimerase/dehydratase family protein n=1 Tax=Thioalkalivibrio sp. XN8 TaxID=2712863 RepID=UPI0013EAD80E|nr:NAD(P)-dependent oxidoreductase [Thioalkalivibrio sp. XN8]NGP53707.1 NAD(P)-dependent oxidoreductase [Thioalkalivibrio sp. XN8]